MTTRIPQPMSAEDFKKLVKKAGGASEAARLFGVARSTIYRWMKKGLML